MSTWFVRWRHTHTYTLTHTQPLVCSSGRIYPRGGQRLRADGWAERTVCSRPHHRFHRPLPRPAPSEARPVPPPMGRHCVPLAQRRLTVMHSITRRRQPSQRVFCSVIFVFGLLVFVVLLFYLCAFVCDFLEPIVAWRAPFVRSFVRSFVLVRCCSLLLDQQTSK